MRLSELTDRQLSLETSVSSWTTALGSLFKDMSILPSTIDDLQTGLRDDIYEQMLLDSQVKSCFGLETCAVLGGGIQLIPRKSDGEDPSQANLDAAYFCKEVLDNLETPLISGVLPDMYRAKVLGNRVAEMTCYKMKDSPIPGKLVLKSIKPQSRKNLYWAVDKFLNVMGFIPNNMPQVPDSIIPRSKFMVLTWKPENSDPRGTSDARCIYISWFYKTQILPILLQYLTQYGSPLLWATTPENAIPVPTRDSNGVVVLDQYGNPIVKDPAVQMLGEIEKLRNGAAFVGRFGTTVNTLSTNGSGDALFQALALFDMQIAKGLLYQTMATENSGGGAKAASTHQDMLYYGFEYGKTALEDMLNRDVLPWLTKRNFPDAEPPKAHIPGVSTRDFLEIASAVAKLVQVGYLDPTQYKALDAELRLPPRSDAAIAQALDKKKAEIEVIRNPPKTFPGAGPPKKKSQLATNQNV